MSAYAKTKFIAKSLILLSIIAIVISGGSYFLLKNQVGADTSSVVQQKDSDNDGIPDAIDPDNLYYEITEDNGTVTGIIANNITSPEVLNFDYKKSPAGDLGQFSGTCRLGEGCYILWNTHSWKNPSIKVANNNYEQPAWAFLLEVEEKAQLAGDTSSLQKIRSIKANYVADAFAKEFTIKLDSNGGKITFDHEQFFQALEKSGIEAVGPYTGVSISDQGKKSITAFFYPSYPQAEPEDKSAWVKAVLFVRDSILPPYAKAGLDTSYYSSVLSQHLGVYKASIAAESKSNSLSLSCPTTIIMNRSDNKAFSYKIDTKIFPQPKEGYKTKFYIKPLSKKDNAAHIYLGPFSDAEGSVTWDQIKTSPYVDQNGQGYQIKPDEIYDYDLTYPQAYVLRVVTYDGDTEKDNILTEFQTVTSDMVGDGGFVSSASSFLKITARPSTVTSGQAVTATIEAVNAAGALPIKKIVVYSCTGTSSEVAKNDSGSCTIKVNGQLEDAIKSVFSTEGGYNALVFQDGRATVTANWDTSGSSIGNHALMAKAFGGDDANQYIDNSKTAVDIKVTNSEAIGGGSSDSHFSDLLASSFNKEASESSRGSSITDIKSLAERIVNILLLLIGGLSVIAIIVGGIFYITSGGDQQKAERGKKTVIYACIGIAIAVLGFVIESAVLDIIGKLVK